MPSDMGLSEADLAAPQEATELLAAISAHAESSQENWDSLGISAGLVGEECQRKVWYGFIWVIEPEQPNAKTISIFETGNAWEDRIIGFFDMACREVWDLDANGSQFKIRLLNGFVRGKCDIVVRGVPGLPDRELFVVEVKSMNNSGFNSAKKHGIRAAKPTYYAQLQVYLKFFDMKRGMLAFVNKNTDEFAVEVIDRDDGYLNVKLGNISNIITSKSPPPRVTEKSDSFMCRFCNFKDLCHNNAIPQRRTCRTCIHSHAVMCDNKYPVFHCRRTDSPMDTGRQKVGCEYHLFETSLIPGDVIETDEDNELIRYKMKDGTEWLDGDILPRNKQQNT